MFYLDWTLINSLHRWETGRALCGAWIGSLEDLNPLESKVYETLASPAMGHWGTCRLNFQEFNN